jgi:hypothetical protein
MGESVAHQQVAELIMNAWNGDRQARKQSEPHTDYKDEKHQSAEKSPLSERADALPNAERDLLSSLSESKLKRQ